MCAFSFHIINVKSFCLVLVEEKREKTVVKIENAKRKIRYEIAELNERLKQKKLTIQKLKDEISKLDGQSLDHSASTEGLSWCTRLLEGSTLYWSTIRLLGHLAVLRNLTKNIFVKIW